MGSSVRGKLYGDRDLLKKISKILDEHTLGVCEPVKKSSQYDDYYTYITILGVRDE